MIERPAVRRVIEKILARDSITLTELQKRSNLSRNMKKQIRVMQNEDNNKNLGVDERYRQHGDELVLLHRHLNTPYWHETSRAHIYSDKKSGTLFVDGKHIRHINVPITNITERKHHDSEYYKCKKIQTGLDVDLLWRPFFILCPECGVKYDCFEVTKDNYVKFINLMHKNSKCTAHIKFRI